MFNRRRRRLLFVIGAACLVLVSGAAAAEPNAFTAAATPSYVQPQRAASYTITLTNSPSSENRAQRAKIGIPPGFSVNPPVTATTTGVEDKCDPSAWEPDGSLIADSKINLKRPGGNSTALCQGATLAVSFNAVSPASEATYTWETDLFFETNEFALIGPSEPTVVVDGTPPTLTIGQQPDKVSNSSSATFTFTASEPHTQCQLDGAAFVPCASPAAYSNLPDGPHTFTVRATDAAGNIREASYTWTSETRSPSAAVSSGPPALSNSRTATFAFAADEPASFECQLDGGSFAACGSPTSYQSLGDGAHTFSVRPIDAVGNLGAVSSYGWTIDATAPQTTVATGPRSGTTALSATFTFRASEQGSFQCRLDGAAFAPCASPRTYSGLKRSSHTFEVRSIDRAGNIDTSPAVRRWTIAVVRRAASAASALLAPRTGARVAAPPLLAWRRVARASYYNVQLFRGRVKVLSTWPTHTRFQLRARWTYMGRQRKLSPGVYRWYVWPAYGPARAHRYGRLLGQSRFTVTAS
jgi:hypothetical protein